MIKMNPKFKAKIRQDLKEVLDEVPLFYDESVEVETVKYVESLYKYTDPTLFNMIVSECIERNRGNIRLTKNLYMLNDTMYYFESDGTGYTIPRAEWETKLEHIKIGYAYDMAIINGAFRIGSDYCNILINRFIENKQDAYIYKNAVYNQFQRYLLVFYMEILLDDKFKSLDSILDDILNNLKEIKEVCDNTDKYELHLSEEDKEIIVKSALFVFVMYMISRDVSSNMILSIVPKYSGSRLFDEMHTMLERHTSAFNNSHNIIVYYTMEACKELLGDKFSNYFVDGIFGLADINNMGLSKDSIEKHHENVKNLANRSLSTIFKIHENETAKQKYIGGVIREATMQICGDAGNNILSDAINRGTFIQLISNKDYNHENGSGIDDILQSFNINRYNNYSETTRYFTDPVKLVEEKLAQCVAKTNSELLCVFKHNKWKLQYDKLVSEYYSKDISKVIKHTSILTKSFKNLTVFFPCGLSVSDDCTMELYDYFNMNILNPKEDEDEILFNRFMDYLNLDCEDKDEFKLIYNETYDLFYSGENKYAMITDEDGCLVCLLNINDFNGSFIIGPTARVYQGLNTRNNMNLPIDIELLKASLRVSGTNDRNIDCHFGKNFYRNDYNIEMMKFSLWYYVKELIHYLNEKKDDGDIELRLVEVEQVKNKKRKSTTFEIHERKSSWVRAHYRHYKSGVVTLVTAHARKGCNVNNSKLVLTL